MVAIVSNSPDTSNLAVPGIGYDGVARVSTGARYGSGTLLWDGRHVLTAAHVVTGADLANLRVELETPSGKATERVNAVAIHPGYDAASDNDDIAVLTLAGPAPANANRYELWRDPNDTGQIVTLVGYGAAATGSAGQLSGTRDILRRWAENKIEGLMDDFAAKQFVSFSPKSGALIYADFDDGSREHDAAGQAFGQFDAGLGTLEGGLSPGDSGGPAFIGNLLAGVASYQLRIEGTNIAPDVNGQTDSSFGEFSVWTRVYAYQEWIDRQVRAQYPNIPTQPSEVQKQVPEGNGGTTLAYFLLQFNGIRTDPQQLLSVDFATRDGTAKALEDYLPVHGRLNLYPGENQAVIAVEILGDAVPETDETFFLDVSNPVGGSFEGGQVTLAAVRTIVDDDVFRG